MKALFTYLTGGRSGQSVTLAKSYALLGRAPHADVRFGPDHDLAVSARHAAVVFRAGTWVLRDLASTNGTFVNGAKVEGEHPLADQDLIRLGDGGPLLRFGILKEDWSAPPLEMVSPPPDPAGDAAPGVPRTPIAVPNDSGAAPVPTAPAGPARLRLGLVGALVAAAAIIAVLVNRPAAPAPPPLSAEQLVLISRADSLFAALEGRRQGGTVSDDEATELLAETARLRSRIRRLAGGAGAAGLRDALDSLEARARQLGT